MLIVYCLPIPTHQLLLSECVRSLNCLLPQVLLTHTYCMHRRLTGLAGGYVLVELGLHLSFEFTGRYGGVWWPFILAHQALR